MPYKTSSCGYDLEFKGPESVDEYDQKAGKVGATLNDAVRGLIAWDTLPEWMEAWAKKLAELTGITRGVDDAATAKAKARAKTPDSVKPVPEKAKGYSDRVTAAVKAGQGANGVTYEQLQAAAQEVANSITIDPAPSQRTGQPKKDLLEKADNILTRDPDAIEASVTKFLDAVSYDLEREADGKPNRESLARLVGKYLDWQLSQV
jgi:hypothetical protein